MLIGLNLSGAVLFVLGLHVWTQFEIDRRVWSVSRNVARHRVASGRVFRGIFTCLLLLMPEGVHVIVRAGGTHFLVGALERGYVCWLPIALFETQLSELLAGNCWFWYKNALSVVQSAAELIKWIMLDDIVVIVEYYCAPELWLVVVLCYVRVVFRNGIQISDLNNFAVLCLVMRFLTDLMAQLNRFKVPWISLRVEQGILRAVEGMLFGLVNEPCWLVHHFGLEYFIRPLLLGVLPHLLIFLNKTAVLELKTADSRICVSAEFGGWLEAWSLFLWLVARGWLSLKWDELCCLHCYRKLMTVNLDFCRIKY